MISGVNLNDRLFTGMMQNSSSLTVLDLHKSHGLNALPFEDLVKNCFKLKEANFGETDLNEQNIAFLCNNLTPKIEELGLENLAVFDKDLKKLITRCKKIKALDLRCTNITKRAIPIISANLKKLQKLALPILFTHSLLVKTGWEKEADWEGVIRSMPELKFFWMMFPSDYGLNNFYQSKVNCMAFTSKIKGTFPDLTLNYPDDEPELGPRIAKYFAPMPEIIHVGSKKATDLLTFLRKVTIPVTQAAKRPNEDLPISGSVWKKFKTDQGWYIYQ